MARIQAPEGSVGTENLPRTRRDLQNCFNNGEGRIISRPGIETIEADTTRVARGQFEWNGSLYQVQSQTLQKITDVTTGASTNIGTIAGPENIRFAIGFNTATIVVQGGALYTLDKTDTLVDISANANIVPSVDIAHINGRFVYIPSSGDPAFFSDVGAAGTVQPLSFFDAEELPDRNNSVFNGKNTLFITGTDSIELFRDTGASPNPFIRIQGSRILNGFIGGLLEYNNTFLFIGREKGQDRGIYSIVQGGAAKISNERIDLILSTYTIAELGQAIANRFKWRGYDIATFNLARDSFAYFGGNWFLLDTVVNDVSRPWNSGFITQFEGDYFSAFSNRIGKIAKLNTDYGSNITRIVDTGFEQENGDFFSCQSIELGISQGFNTASTPRTVAIQMSRDNVQYGPFLFRELGLIGEYQDKLIWNYTGGLGNYDGFMGVRFFTTDDVDFSTDFIIAKLR